jgi:hypothetical protein
VLLCKSSRYAYLAYACSVLWWSWPTSTADCPHIAGSFHSSEVLCCSCCHCRWYCGRPGCRSIWRLLLQLATQPYTRTPRASRCAGGFEGCKISSKKSAARVVCVQGGGERGKHGRTSFVTAASHYQQISLAAAAIGVCALQWLASSRPLVRCMPYLDGMCWPCLLYCRLYNTICAASGLDFCTANSALWPLRMWCA